MKIHAFVWTNWPHRKTSADYIWHEASGLLDIIYHLCRIYPLNKRKLHDCPILRNHHRPVSVRYVRDWAREKNDYMQKRMRWNIDWNDMVIEVPKNWWFQDRVAQNISCPIWTICWKFSANFHSKSMYPMITNHKFFCIRLNCLGNCACTKWRNVPSNIHPSMFLHSIYWCLWNFNYFSKKIEYINFSNQIRSKYMITSKWHLIFYLSSRSRPSNLATTFTARTGGLQSRLYSNNFLLIFWMCTKFQTYQRLKWISECSFGFDAIRFDSIRFWFNSEVYCLHLSYDSKSTNHYQFFYVFILICFVVFNVWIKNCVSTNVNVFWLSSYVPIYTLKDSFFWQHSTHTDLGVEYNYQRYLHTLTRTCIQTFAILTFTSPICYYHRQHIFTKRINIILLFWEKSQLSSNRCKLCWQPLNINNSNMNAHDAFFDWN